MGIHDVGYQMTRHPGSVHAIVEATVIEVNSVEANPRTGVRTYDYALINVENVVKEPTRYAAFISAREASQDVGDTTFVFWSEDVPFTKLDPEDYVITSGERYQVVSSRLEDTALVVTAKAYRGALPTQIMTVLVSQGILTDSATVE